MSSSQRHHYGGRHARQRGRGQQNGASGGSGSGSLLFKRMSPAELWEWTKQRFLLLMLQPSQAIYLCVPLLCIEVILNLVVIQNVKYTEIDWKAYMQEVEGVLSPTNGTYDYSKLRGDTGPLVYPAGFVWLFSGLYYLTDQGQNIRLAQYLFAFLYVVTLALVFRIALKTEKLPPYVLIFMSCFSYRIHSIYVLRLFNDPVSMFFLYLAVNLFLSNHWSLGSVAYSLAVSVKMNILLFAPALLLAYLATQGLLGTLKQLCICAAVQLGLAWPFLASYPLEYLKGAFDVGRVFLFEWTVNWRFLPEEVFVHKYFHLSLLVLTLLCMAVCVPKWWKMLTSYDILRHNDAPEWCCQLLVLPLFMSNFIGIVFSRSLHYQFYVWYFHQLHYLLWCTRLPDKGKLLMLGLIELCWNVYPSTVWSSGLLHACHLVLLAGLAQTSWSIGKPPPPPEAASFAAAPASAAPAPAPAPAAGGGGGGGAKARVPAPGNKKCS